MDEKDLRFNCMQLAVKLWQDGMIEKKDLKKTANYFLEYVMDGQSK